jgi:hypothetical protein
VSDNERSAELLQQPWAFQLRVTEMSEGLRGLKESRAAAFGPVESAPEDAQLAVEERDMSRYTNIVANKNPLIPDVPETSPENVAQITDYARSLASPSKEPDYDIPEAA